DSKNIFGCNGGTVSRYDGVSWKAVARGVGAVSVAAFGFSPSDVWCASSTTSAGLVNSNFVHYDGKAWTQFNLTGALGQVDGIWAARAEGIIRRSTDGGATWATIPSGTTNEIFSLWALSPTDIWAAGVNVLLHWDGTSWSTVSTPFTTSLFTVWASSPTDVW